MATLLALVRKDLRLVRWPWLGYVALLLAKLGLGAWCILATRFTPADGALALRLNTLLTGAGLIVTCLLVFRLVQADALLRPRAFWRTRPVTGAHLLAAKTLGVFIVCGAAPVLVALPWWLANGLGGADLALAATELLGFQALVCLPSLLIASLVDSFGRAVIWSIIQFGVIGCIGLLVGPSLNNLNPTEFGLDASRLVIAAGVVALLLPALITWQFLRRRTVAVIVGVALLHGAALAVLLHAPFNLIQKGPGWVELHPEMGREVTLQPAVEARFDYRPRMEAGFEYVRLRWPMGGFPPDLFADVRVNTFTLRDGHSELGSAETIWSLANPGAGDRLRTFIAPPTTLSRAPGDLSESGAPSPSIDMVLKLGREQAERLEGRPLAVDCTVRVHLFRTELCGNLPLAAGRWRADRFGGIRVVQVDPTNEGVSATFVTTEADSLWRAVAWNLADDNWSLAPPNVPATGCLDYIVGADGRRPRKIFHAKGPNVILGVSIKRVNVSYAPGFALSDGKRVSVATDLPAWRAGLRLVRVAHAEAARVLLTGHTEGLMIKGSPGPARP